MEEREAWAKSAEGKAVIDAMKKGPSYGVNLSPDGSFRAEEVLPGKYELDITLWNSAEPPRGPSDSVGRFKVPVVIPEPAGPEDDSTVDLGTLEGRVEPLAMRSQESRLNSPAPQPALEFLHADSGLRISPVLTCLGKKPLGTSVCVGELCVREQQTLLCRRNRKPQPSTPGSLHARNHSLNQSLWRTIPAPNAGRLPH